MTLRSFFLTMIIVGFLLLGLATFLRFSNYFTVQEISCQMNGEECPDFVLAELNKSRGGSFFFSDFELIQKNILANTPSAKSVELNREFPNRLSITISTTQSAYVIIDSAIRAWSIDEEGFTHAVRENKGDPSLNVSIAPPFQFFLSDTNKLPEELHQNLLKTFKILADPFFVDTTFSLTSEREAQLTLDDQKKAFFSLDKSDQDLAKLKYFMEHYNPKDFKEPIKDIDLRFGQVVVRTVSGSSSIKN